MTCAAKRFYSFLSMLALFLSVSANLSVAQRTTSFSAVHGSFTPTTDAVTGDFSSANMEVDVVLVPRNESALSDLLADRYNPQSKNYQHWLAAGEFYARFAPTAQQTKAVSDYLRKGGLEIETTSSPFLIRVSGPSSMIENLFKTNIRTYRNRKGIDYFSNDSEIQLPASVASQVRGVIGLSNTVRFQSMRSRPMKRTAPPPTPNCETPYPTEEQLANDLLGIAGFAFGYGGSPGCNGLRPAQDNAIYGAAKSGAFGKRDRYRPCRL